MKILIDENNLLTIENPNIPKTKEYCYNVGGYNFCDFDKWVVVYHKNNFKIINLKDLGDKMAVIMVGEKDEELDELMIDINSVENALRLFKWFDEDTWKKYYFLHKFWEDKLENLKKKLKKVWSNIVIEKTRKGICCEYKEDDLEYDPISFLFWLYLLYWDFNVKNNDLKSIKIQIPLFWIHKENADIIDEVVGTLSDNWIFLKKHIQETSDGIVYQITSSDYELLQIFAKLYEPIEKWLQISKYDDTLKIKEELMEFLKINKEIPSEWKEEVLKQIENGMIKILLK